MSRPALYTKHTRLADQISNAYFLPGADADDVRQEARLALWIATANYRPDRGASFRTYAGIAIRAHLNDCVKSATRNKNKVLTDAKRDTQLELIPADELERTVIARERLRHALGIRAQLWASEQTRRRWAKAKRRQRAAA